MTENQIIGSTRKNSLQVALNSEYLPRFPLECSEKGLLRSRYPTDSGHPADLAIGFTVALDH